jgi:hypothetical protein
MHKWIIVSVLLNQFFTNASVSAPQNPFVGNTVRAKYHVTDTRCNNENKCEIASTVEFDWVVYVGTNHDVFDYSVNKSGTEYKLFQHYNVGAGDIVWSVKNENLMSTVSGKTTLGTVRAETLFSSIGHNKCTVFSSTKLQYYTFKARIDLHSCEIIPGDVER